MDRYEVFVYSKCGMDRAQLGIRRDHQCLHFEEVAEAGKDAYAHLRHIRKNYDKLHRVTVFMKGKRLSISHSPREV